MDYDCDMIYYKILLSKFGLYQAGMEDENRNFENQLFDKIPETVTSNNKPAGFDKDAKNKNVSKLFSAENGQRVGPGVVLKVMAGDKFKARIFGWYQPGTITAENPLAENIVYSLLNSLGQGILGGGSKGTISELTSPMGILSGSLTSFMNDPKRPYNFSRPKAYLNWILLDACAPWRRNNLKSSKEIMEQCKYHRLPERSKSSLCRQTAAMKSPSIKMGFCMFT